MKSGPPDSLALILSMTFGWFLLLFRFICSREASWSLSPSDPVARNLSIFGAGLKCGKVLKLACRPLLVQRLLH